MSSPACLGLDEVTEHVLEQIEVGVELTSRMFGEASRRLAHSEAKNGRAGEPFDSGNSIGADPCLSEPTVDALSHLPSAGCGCRTLEKEREDCRMPACGPVDSLGETGQPLVPGEIGGWLGELGQQPLDQAVEQVGFVGDMPVESHRCHFEAVGDSLHGDGFEAPLVGDGQPGGEDGVSVD